uniref:Major capsid protein n=1 Tax=viral metagenome TaxID=1070528 RepID=A0A6C0EK81_9ZZZZ
MTTQSNITSGFIDLATYDEMEKYMYGGSSATAYFVRETRKATWFTQVPVVLSRSNGNAEFGTDHSVSISRAGDYLLHAWLRVNFPSVTLDAANSAGVNGRLRWTRNLMHNLIQECSISFNDLVAARFDNYHLDFWAAFTVPAGKRNGYSNMIGDVLDLTNVHAAGVANAIPAATLNLPLPFWFARDSGVALPTAALPYNEMRINYTFRAANELLILDNIANAGAGVAPSAAPVATDLTNGFPVLGTVQTWANYAIVSNDERKRMACAPRNILIEQAQTAPLQTFAPATNTSPSYDLRFSHAIKVLFFAVRNSTIAPQWSNYTAASYFPGAASVDTTPSGAVDPIVTTSLTYENTARMSAMGSDYFSLIQPWYHAPFIPIDTGYHMYSYSLDFVCLDPKGSTNFGKLTNVTVSPVASVGAQTGAAGTGAATSGQDYVQTYRFITTTVNNNIIRVSGGALGFPVL